MAANLPPMSKEVLTKFYAAINKRNYEVLKELTTPNIRSTRIGHPVSVGHDGFVDKGMREWLTSCPDVQLDIIKTAVDGDDGFVWSKITGFPGGYAKMSVDIYRFEAGKIAEHWDVQQEVPE